MLILTLILLQICHKMEVNKSWKITNDKSKNTLRISSIESDYYVYNTGEKLPIDIEIFQNLVDNICRKFNIDNGENLLCFGGCAIYNKVKVKYCALPSTNFILIRMAVSNVLKIFFQSIPAS